MGLLELIGVLLVVAIVVTVLIYCILSGLVEAVVVKTIESYKCKGSYAYKNYTGDYSSSGPAFTEVSSIHPDLPCLAIYYDDPKRTDKEQCRYSVGALIGEEVENQKRESIISTFRSHGYEIHEMENAGKAVYCSFPYVTQMSIFLGVARVYPQMTSYILEKRLDAHVFIEHYTGDTINFIAPLERHEEFIMPGVAKSSPAEESLGETTPTESLLQPFVELKAPVEITEEKEETVEKVEKEEEKEKEKKEECDEEEGEMTGPIVAAGGDLSKVEEAVPEHLVTKRDEDSASSASSFEEVQKEDCSTSSDPVAS